jgi:hypothetical protein
MRRRRHHRADRKRALAEIEAEWLQEATGVPVIE